MPPRSQLRLDATVFRRVSRSGLGWSCALILILLGGGCVSRPQPARLYVSQTAVVRVENHTEWPWRIAFVRTETTAPTAPAPSYITPSSALEVAPPSSGLPWLTLAPRETRSINLPGGIYRVHREVKRPNNGSLAPEPGAASDAGVSLWLVAGRNYTWPLATLFSTEEVAP